MVAQGIPNQLDALCERLGADRTSIPDSLLLLVMVEHLGCGPNQGEKQIEGEPRKIQHIGPAPDLAGSCIDLDVIH